jgi:Apea-like HEPN
VKAREWYERGNQVSDPVEAFSNYWRGFNNLFFGVGNGNESEKIKLFLKQRVTESQATKLLQDHPHNITYLLSQPVIDMRGNGRNTTPNIQAFNIAVDSVTKLQELFMVIYQVRCNLEHGQKSPRRERDIQLCKLASPFVAEVLDHNA